jgi:hypothetical protein
MKLRKPFEIALVLALLLAPAAAFADDAMPVEPAVASGELAVEAPPSQVSPDLFRALTTPIAIELSEGSADATARRRDEFHAVDEYGADAFVLERGLGVGDGRECPGVDLDPSAVLLCVGVAEVEGGLNDRLIALADQSDLVRVGLSVEQERQTDRCDQQHHCEQAGEDERLRACAGHDLALGDEPENLGRSHATASLNRSESEGVV